MLKILFVTAGDVCRGPMCTVMFRDVLDRYGVKDVAVTHAGMKVKTGGEAPMPAVVGALERRGLAAGDYRSVALTDEMLEEANFIVCPTEGIVSALTYAAESSRLFCLRGGVAEPGFGSEKTYDRLAYEIENCLTDLYQRRVEVRAVPMTTEHIPRIAEIEKACFKKPWTEQMLLDELDVPGARFFAAVDSKGETVGYVGANNNAGEVYLGDVAVLPSRASMGVGTVLLNKLITVCIAEDAEFISLEVRKSNLAGRRLYERCGFREVGKRPDFYSQPTEDAIVMTKRLKW